MLGSGIHTSIKKEFKIKSSTLIILFIGMVVSLVGCKGDTCQVASESVPEELVLNVMDIDHESMELAIQVGWLRGCLEKCLAELEAQHGLEPIPFDWAEARGFPKTKSDPNIAKKYALKSQPFYMPYPPVKRPEIKTERYTDPEILSAYIDIQLSARRVHMLGMDRYIKHLEERLKRLEENLTKEPKLQNETDEPK